MAIISASGTFIRSGPASTSAWTVAPPQNQRLLEPAHANPHAGNKFGVAGGRFCIAATPRSACDRERVATTAASASAARLRRGFAHRRLDFFSICARSSRSFHGLERAPLRLPVLLAPPQNASRVPRCAFAAARPTPPQRAPLRFQLRRFFARFALHLLHLVAAAMQIGDQSRASRASGVNPAWPARSRAPANPAAARCRCRWTPRHAHAQPIGRRQTALRRTPPRHSPRPAWSKHKPSAGRDGWWPASGAARAKFFQQRHGQRRAFFGRRACAHLVHQHQ